MYESVVPVHPASGPSSDMSPQSLIVSQSHDGGTQIDVFTQRNGAAAGQPLCPVVMVTVVDDNRLPATAVTTQHHVLLISTLYNCSETDR